MTKLQNQFMLDAHGVPPLIGIGFSFISLVFLMPSSILWFYLPCILGVHESTTAPFVVWKDLCKSASVIGSSGDGFFSPPVVNVRFSWFLFCWNRRCLCWQNELPSEFPWWWLHNFGFNDENFIFNLPSFIIHRCPAVISHLLDNFGWDDVYHLTGNV